MLVASTIGLRTGLLPRWLVVAGYVCGVVFLLTVTYVELLALLLAAWAIAVSVVILRTGGRGRAPRQLTTQTVSQVPGASLDLVERRSLARFEPALRLGDGLGDGQNEPPIGLSFLAFAVRVSVAVRSEASVSVSTSCGEAVMSNPVPRTPASSRTSWLVLCSRCMASAFASAHVRDRDRTG